MKDKPWIKELIWAIVVLILTIPTYFGFEANNEILETVCKMLACAGAGVSVMLGIRVILNVTINKDDHSIHIDDHSMHDDHSTHNDDHSTTVNNSPTFNAGNSTNNGIQANNIGAVVLPPKEEKNINPDELNHCKFIISEMDALLKFLDYPCNDPLNSYIGKGMVNGEYYEGDYKNLYNLYDYLSKNSVVFNDETLGNAIKELYGAIAQFYFDLGRYTHSYGDGRKTKDMWSLYYLIYEHPYVYTVDEKLGEITQDVKNKADEQLHQLQNDKRDLEYKYKHFIEIYNKLR